MIEQTISIERIEDVIDIFGSFDENIKLIEHELDVSVVSRDDQLKISGEAENVLYAVKAVQGLLGLAGRKETITEQNVRYIINLVKAGNEEHINDIARDVLCVTAKGKPIKPKTLGQKRYVDAIKKNTITLGIGPAGTGKTYLAVAAAVAAMLVVTVSAANSEAIMTYLTSLRDAAVAGEAWADSPVNTEEGTGGLCLPEASLEERDGRTILIVDGVENDVTQALTDQGEYLYECGEGEEQAQVRVYLDEQGAPRLMTSFFTAGEDGGTGAVVVVPADGEE